MITARQRISAALNHKTLDRIPICETAYWPETIERWKKEGLPADTDPIDYFDLDRIVVQNPFSVSFFPHDIIEETDEYCIDVNPYGTTVKYPKNAGSSAGFIELDHKVNTIEDWRKAKQRLDVSEKRLTPRQPIPEGAYVTVSTVDHFWMSFCMCGLENMCCWLLQRPEEFKEIYQDYTTFLLGMLDLYISKGDDFDALWFFSDMAYHSGPMFSPEIFMDVVAPYYRQLKAWCVKHNKAFLLHSDGNMNKLMPGLIDVGFDWTEPIEVRADNDLIVYKKKYGDKITLMGGINADIIAEGYKNKIEDEIASKIPTAKANGGYIYHIDHSVPPTISFEAYSHLIEMVKKYGQY